MEDRKNAPAGQGGRRYIIEKVYSHGIVVQKKYVIPRHRTSRRKCGGPKR